MTLLLSAVAVPINTVFGVTCAILIARNEFPGKLVMMSMLDLPFSISPVVTGQLAISWLYAQCFSTSHILHDQKPKLVDNAQCKVASCVLVHVL